MAVECAQRGYDMVLTDIGKAKLDEITQDCAGDLM